MVFVFCLFYRTQFVGNILESVRRMCERVGGPRFVVLFAAENTQREGERVVQFITVGSFKRLVNQFRIVISFR